MATTEHGKWIERSARIGYIARGVVYVAIGFTALMAALEGGSTEGSKGVIAGMLDEPGGQFFVGTIALGLLCYAIWRFIQSITDADNHGTDFKGGGIRSSLAVSGITYVLLSVWAGALIFGGGGSQSDGQTKQAWTAQLMSVDYGRWLVGFIGVAIIGVGVGQVVRAVKEKYQKRLKLDSKKMARYDPICKAGLIARGVVFFIIGGFVIYAAAAVDPGKVRGLNGTLETVRAQTYGPWLLGLLALGLLAFGIYSIIEGVYRRIDVTSTESAPHMTPATA
jgi:hypothetical protein